MCVCAQVCDNVGSLAKSIVVLSAVDWCELSAYLNVWAVECTINKICHVGSSGFPICNYNSKKKLASSNAVKVNSKIFELGKKTETIGKQ